MAARHDMEHLLLAGHLQHGISDAGVHVAEDHVHFVAVDELLRLLDAGADVVGGVLDEQFDLPSEDAALLVDLVARVLRALDLALRQRGQDAGQRIDHADLDRLLAARAQDERCGELERAECHACLEQPAPT